VDGLATLSSARTAKVMASVSKRLPSRVNVVCIVSVPVVRGTPMRVVHDCY
jgi:hypothetical protein